MKEETETKMLDIREVPEDVIKSALSTAFSECYGALSFCNAMGGEQTPKWVLLHTFHREGVVQEQLDRGLDISTLKTAIPDDVLVVETEAYKDLVKKLQAAK